MTFVAMHFDPPVKWMTDEQLLDLPMLDTFQTMRTGPFPKCFVDYSEASDMWWYGEKHSDSKITWYRVIVVRPHYDRPFDDSGEQDG